jgi:hypothetical protein
VSRRCADVDDCTTLVRQLVIGSEHAFEYGRMSACPGMTWLCRAILRSHCALVVSDSHSTVVELICRYSTEAITTSQSRIGVSVCCCTCRVVLLNATVTPCSTYFTRRSDVMLSFEHSRNSPHHHSHSEDRLRMIMQIEPVLDKCFRQCFKDCLRIAIREKHGNYFRPINSFAKTVWYPTLRF